MKRRKTTETLSLAHRRYGWTALFIWLLFGVVLEGLEGFKLTVYLQDALRQEFWQLAHFHGATLSLANLVYTLWADDPHLSAKQQQWASRALIMGSILMPLGFFLGGLVHFEGDPGLGIFLSPPGALLILFTIGIQTIAAWRS